MNTIHFLFFFFLILFSCGKETEDRRRRNFDLSVWSEFDYEKAYKIYPELKKRGIEIHLAVFPDKMTLQILKDFEFRAWLLLPKEDGYWVSTYNAKKFSEFAKKFFEIWKGKHQWIILDFEPPIQIAEKLAKGDISAFKEILKEREDFEEGKNILKSMIEDLKTKGAKILCTYLPFILDDLLDGDDDIQKKLGTPLLDCDEFSFMIYRTALRRLFPSISNYVVYSYSTTAQKFFKNFAIDVGLVGDDSFGNKGYSSPEELKEDISAGLAAGVKKFHIWSLDNMKDFSWLLEYVEPKIPEDDNATLKMRKIFIELLD